MGLDFAVSLVSGILAPVPRRVVPEEEILAVARECAAGMTLEAVAERTGLPYHAVVRRIGAMRRALGRENPEWLDHRRRTAIQVAAGYLERLRTQTKTV